MRSELQMISYESLKEAVVLDAALVNVIEEAFITLAKGDSVVPPIQQIPLAAVAGQVCVKSAYVAHLPFFVVKIAGNFPGNPARGESNNQGCMCLFEVATGKLDTLLADNGLLTQLRTAASGAVAARYLAPESVARVATIGAGVQARLQLQALALVRDFERVSVFSRTRAKSEALAQWVRETLGKECAVCADIDKAVAEADVILTTTRASAPLLQVSQLADDRPVHITAMGADAPDKNELSPDLYDWADRYVCDLKSQSLQLGELRSVAAAGIDDFRKVEELGSLCLQQLSRRREDRLTVCDLTGVGILDLAIALYARNLFLAD